MLRTDQSRQQAASGIVARLVDWYTTRQIEDEIATLDAEIRRRDAEIRDALRAQAKAEREKALLQQVLAYMSDDTLAATSVAAAQSSSSDGHRPARRKPVSKREPILRLMRQRRESDPSASRWWSVAEVREGLARMGFEASRNLVRMTLRRMADRGQLVAHQDGTLFGLPE